MRRGKTGECFTNAGRVILQDGIRKPHLHYCEGFMGVDAAEGIVWCHHAWLQSGRAGKIQEITTLPTAVSQFIVGYHAIVRLCRNDYVIAGSKRGYAKDGGEQGYVFTLPTREGIRTARFIFNPILPCEHIGCEDHRQNREQTERRPT